MKGPLCHEVVLCPGEPPWGSAHSSREAPSTFGHIVRPGFEFSPRARAGPRAAVVKDEGFVLSGVLVMLSTLSCSSQILATQSVAASLRPRPNRRARPPPRSHVAHAGSRDEVIAGRGAAC